MVWCFSTGASVATVLTTHPCVSRCLRVKIQNFLLKKMRMKMSSAKWQPFYIGLNVLFKSLIFKLKMINFCYKTKVGSPNFGHQQLWPFVHRLPKLVATIFSQFQRSIVIELNTLCRVEFYIQWCGVLHCPASRTTLVATRFRVAVICPIIQVPHCIRVFFYFVWFVFINHIFQFYYELCTYCNILDIYLS